MRSIQPLSPLFTNLLYQCYLELSGLLKASNELWPRFSPFFRELFVDPWERETEYVINELLHALEFGSFWGVDSYSNIGHTVLVIDMPVTCTLSFSWLYAITWETILINTGLLPNFETGTIVPSFLWSNSKVSDRVHGSNLTPFSQGW